MWFSIVIIQLELKIDPSRNKSPTRLIFLQKARERKRHIIRRKVCPSKINISTHKMNNLTEKYRESAQNARSTLLNISNIYNRIITKNTYFQASWCETHTFYNIVLFMIFTSNNPNIVIRQFLGIKRYHLGQCMLSSDIRWMADTSKIEWKIHLEGHGIVKKKMNVPWYVKCFVPRYVGFRNINISQF